MAEGDKCPCDAVLELRKQLKEQASLTAENDKQIAVICEKMGNILSVVEQTNHQVSSIKKDVASAIKEAADERESELEERLKLYKNSWAQAAKVAKDIVTPILIAAILGMLTLR